MKTLRQWIEDTAKLSREGVIQNVDFTHYDVEHDYATMCDLNMNSFTPAGLEKFAKVLDAEVVNAFPIGHEYYQVNLKGASPKAIREFSQAQAGYCTEEEYTKWYTEN